MSSRIRSSDGQNTSDLETISTYLSCRSITTVLPITSLPLLEQPPQPTFVGIPVHPVVVLVRRPSRLLRFSPPFVLGGYGSYVNNVRQFDFGQVYIFVTVVIFILLCRATFFGGFL